MDTWSGRPVDTWSGRHAFLFLLAAPKCSGTVAGAGRAGAQGGRVEPV